MRFYSLTDHLLMHKVYFVVVESFYFAVLVLKPDPYTLCSCSCLGIALALANNNNIMVSNCYLP